MHIEAPGELDKLQVPGPHPQRLWFSESEVGAKNLHCDEPPRWIGGNGPETTLTESAEGAKCPSKAWPLLSGYR